MKTVFIAIIILIVNSLHVSAQRRNFNRMHKSDFYLGFGGSFGIRTQQVASSSFNEIKKSPIVQEGGSGAIVSGNRIVRAKGEMGFYFSSANMVHTVELVELGLSANVYPLQIFTDERRIFQPYLTAGVFRSKQRFYGFYHLDESEVANYSVTVEPFVGKTINTLATAGAGFEVSLRDDHSFVHIFAEGRYSQPIASRATERLTETSLGSQLMVNIGIVFGRHY